MYAVHICLMHHGRICRCSTAIDDILLKVWVDVVALFNGLFAPLRDVELCLSRTLGCNGRPFLRHVCALFYRSCSGTVTAS